MGTFYRTVKKKLSVSGFAARMWANKKLTALVAVAFLVFLYVLFNNNGLVQRYRLERSKVELTRKIKEAEEQQKRLQDQSRALDGDPKAIEKVAREKYGMVRQGDKVYRVVPKK